MGNVTYKFLKPRQAVLFEISGGVCPVSVSPPVSPPVAPPPVAEPHFIATNPGAVQGSMWVESSELHSIDDSSGNEYAETGASVATPPGAVLGSLWLEGADIHYIDSSGVERTISKTSLGAKPAPATVGSLWMDTAPAAGKRVEWIEATNKYQWWNTI